MVMMMNDIESIWRHVEGSIEAENIRKGFIKRLIMPQWKDKIFLGIEIETSKRFFVFEAPYKVLRKLGSLPQTNGFEASVRYLGDEEENFLSLFIIVKRTQFHDLFVSLIKDILEHLAPLNTEHAVEIIISRLLRWQKFLERFHFEGLGEEAQRGLFGELFLLNRLLEVGINSTAVIEAWKGPEKTVHDFIFESCSVEVKTSISKQHQKVYISSERQLDNSQSGELYLCHYSLDNQSGQGFSLNQIIQFIREEISAKPLVSELFEEQLFEAGYLDIHSERYDNPTYSIREYNLFKVSEGFPRIVENDLNEGVGDVNYSIMISQCKHFLVQENVVLNMIGDVNSNG